MAYVGTPLDTTNAFQSLAGKRFSGDASTTDFTLDSSPNSTLDIEVFVENVRQDPNSAYTVSGTTLAFTGAPPSGTNNIYVVHQAKAVGTIDVPVGSTLDLNGAAELILDADADTSITADTDDQIDIRVGGSDIATLTSSALTLKNSATADNSTFTVNLQTAEADIAADDIIAKINFQAPNEGTGTDANLIAASIQATSEGDFSSSSNATKLEFMTGASEAATTKMQIVSNGNIYIPNDDVGFSFGASQDLWFGDYAGEEGLQINRGAAQVANPLGSGGGGGAAFIFYNPGTSAAAEIQTVAGEGKSASINLKQDQHDNASDQWWFGQQGTDFADNTSLFWTDYDASSADAEMSLTQAGVLTAEGAMNASTTVDYAEYFEWKTELANDDKITETYGLSVVLDNGKVRLAEAGEEAKVLGVVRPNNVSAMVGGSHEFRYKDRYEKNVWGEPVREEYTLVTWNETRTKYWKDGDNLPEGKSVGDVRGTYVHGHVYPKDRIPSKVLKPEWELDRSEHNWHTLASNLTSEDLVVPSTDDEKSAANYTERSTYKRDKGDGHKKGDKLTRKKINSSYDSTKTYIPRNKRRKEWCIVGLIGQVEVRDTAIVPTSWTKMKNLESGIDLYYIK